MNKFDKKIKDICKGMGDIIDELQNKDSAKKIKDMEKDDANFGGVYVLWEKGKAIYVGRASNISRRIIENHRSANIGGSSLASHLMREKVAEHAKDISYMVRSYNEGREGKKIKSEVDDYLASKKNENLEKIIMEFVKKRIGDMHFTCIKVGNYWRELLIEIFCMHVLKTMAEEQDPKENINKTTFSYKKFNFS